MSHLRVRAYDLISELPDNIVENILTYLPTPDVVRTSILSNKWRYTWTKVPTFILDENFWNEVYADCRIANEWKRSYMTKVSADRVLVGEWERSFKTKLYRILCHFLSLHQGPIKTFRFSGFDWDCPELGNLIFFLSMKGVEDFTLSMKGVRYYKLPSSFFGCEKLKHLDLEDCWIDNTPKNFGGFRRLITMRMCNCRIDGEVLEKIISKCPLLEVLCLVRTYDAGEVIQIDAANLKSFVYTGPERIIFKNVPLLSSVRMNDTCRYGVNLDMFVDNLPLLQKLHIGAPWTDIVPRWLSTTLDFLRDLSFSVDQEVSTLCLILRLIGSSPHLRHMSIEFRYWSTEIVEAFQFLKEQDFSNIRLDELEQLKLLCVSGTRYELEVINLLLSKSTNLKTIILDRRCRRGEMLKILPEEAEVIYIDGGED